MATLREYYEKDSSSKALKVSQNHTLTNKLSGESHEVEAAVSLDFTSGAKYVWLFVPDEVEFVSAVASYLHDIDLALDVAEDVKVVSGFAGIDEAIEDDDCFFTGRLLVYTPGSVTPDERTQINTIAEENDISVVIRDESYAEQRDKLSRPKAFISHDSRDKDPLVRELASKLQSMLCPVWYDEYSLSVGDSLRESIESGLKECDKCILVISTHFIDNDGWTKAEFDSVYTREIHEEENVILPVWHNVSKEQVYEYSPRLADRVALNSDMGVEKLAKKLYGAIDP
jgi:hypothetical protein